MAIRTKSLAIFAALFAVVFMAVTQGADAVASGDWPGWRGAHRDDISTETGLLKTWPKDGPPLAWKATGMGEGFSSVSVVGKFIYTMGDFGEPAPKETEPAKEEVGPNGKPRRRKPKSGIVNPESHILALNLNDGSVAWKVKVGVGGQGGGYPGTRCTPTVDGERIYATGQNGDIVCVYAADGKEVWRKNMKNDFGGEMMSGWGYSESPLVDGQLLICTPGGKKGTLVALDKATGELKWRTGELTDKAAYSSPIAVDIGGVHQLIQLTDQDVFGADAATGKILWKAARRGGTAVIPTPIYHDNFVFVTSGYGAGCNGFKIEQNGKEFKAEEVYASKAIVNHHGGVVLVGDNLYGHSDNGGWKCLDFKTGTEKWKDQGIGKGSVTYADGMLYMRSEGKGTVALVEATPTKYNLVSEFDQPERSGAAAWPHPVVTGGKLYIRDQDKLFCYEVKSK